MWLVTLGRTAGGQHGGQITGKRGQGSEADNLETGDGKESKTHIRLATGRVRAPLSGICMLRNGELWG